MNKLRMKKGGKWIQKAIKNPGAFTEQAKRANLAKTLAGMKRGQMGMQMSAQNQAKTNPKKKKKPVVPNYKPHKVGIMSIKMKRGGKVKLSSFLSGKNKKCK